MWLFRRQDRSEAFLSAELQDLHPVEVTFSNGVQLRGVSLSRDAAGVTLKLRWRALTRMLRPLRCFAHVFAEGRQISSLDHEILRHGPSIVSWEAGDEGFESLRLSLSNRPDGLEIRLGLYDSEINVRVAVLVSTLPVVDEGSAVRLPTGVTPGIDYTVKFDPLPLTPCRVVFEDGLFLSAYSVAQQDNLVWLRLKWIVARGRRRSVRFFGHLVAEPAPEGPTLLQFDQDFVAERRGPVTAVEQNVVRKLEPTAASGSVLRAGAFRPSTSYRLKIETSTFPFDAHHRCLYLPFSAAQSECSASSAAVQADLAFLVRR